MTMQEETLQAGLERRRDDAKQRGDLATYLFFARLLTEREQFQTVGALAARIYQDNSDESAWNELFDALSTAGLL